MYIVGQTDDRQFVVAGVGILYFEQGLPPSVIFDSLKAFNLIPSFQHFYEELKTNGMSSDRIVHLLNEHVFESYGPEFRDKVISKLKLSY